MLQILNGGIKTALTHMEFCWITEAHLVFKFYKVGTFDLELCNMFFFAAELHISVYTVCLYQYRSAVQKEEEKKIKTNVQSVQTCIHLSTCDIHLDRTQDL